MNLILYEKTSSSNTELKEYLKNKSGVNVYTASSKEEVIKLFMQLKNVEWLVFLSASIPSDLGLVQFVKENRYGTKIIFFASPIIKESIEIIKDSEIILMDDSFDKLKEIHQLIKTDYRDRL
ncbi:MAG: hypothetical protein AB1775_09735 [Bacteroidota bacterium]